MIKAISLKTLGHRESERLIRASNMLLKFLGRATSRRQYVDALVRLLKEWSGCRYVGIQLIEQGVFSSQSYQGFSKKFWEKFVAHLPEEKKTTFHKISLKNKFTSGVTIPVRYRMHTIAKICLADEHPDILSAEKIEFIEHLTPLIGESLHKFSMEDKMRNVQERWDQAKRLADIGRLAATVAHELRNPLAAINMATHNIRHKKQNLPIDKHLDNIEKKIFESDRIINNLLFYSRIRIPHYESVRIYEILNECIEAVKKRFNKERITIVKQLAQVRKVLIKADPVQMKELFMNILTNACDAVVGKKGKITIGGELNNGDIGIYIKDNGIGMNEEDLKRTTEPFFTTKAKGTGLGLTVSQQIVSLHKGKMFLKSQANHGTTVTVILPRKK